jgi:hypothetical protein
MEYTSGESLPLDTKNVIGEEDKVCYFSEYKLHLEKSRRASKQVVALCPVFGKILGNFS